MLRDSFPLDVNEARNSARQKDGLDIYKDNLNIWS